LGETFLKGDPGDLGKRTGPIEMLTQTDMKEFTMMITPRELLDTSIAQLRTLAGFLGEQLGDGRDGAESATAETRACHEILRSLRVLILRLQAARPDTAGGCGALPPIWTHPSVRRERQTAKAVLRRLRALVPIINRDD